MRAFLFSALLALSLFSMSCPADADESRDQRKPENPSLAAARTAIQAKDYTAALQHLTAAAQETPNDVDVQSLLGYSHRKLGSYDKSMEHYQKALAIDANHRGTREYLGELYLDMNQPAEAEKQLTALKKACPLFFKCEEYEDLKKAIARYRAK
ncbi:MAG: hypothetical protein DMD81_21935 [Candidatus Rokuibacteriota bacterium]|nr:MAG: hypothetical protein DMD81_21935 [Candidatus Rokubacteria bacterium]